MPRLDLGMTMQDSTGVPRLTVLRTACCDLGPFGYVCTLDRHHGGEQHRAELDGAPFATWPTHQCRSEP